MNIIKKIRLLVESPDEEMINLGLCLIHSERWYESFKCRFSNLELEGDFRTYGDLCPILDRVIDNNFQIPFMWGDSGKRKKQYAAKKLLNFASEIVPTEPTIF